MLAPTCDFQEPGDDSDPVGPPQEPPGTTRFSRPELGEEGVEEAVMVPLDVLVGELDATRKVTEATYPSPVMLESDENTTVR